MKEDKHFAGGARMSRPSGLCGRLLALLTLACGCSSPGEQFGVSGSVEGLTTDTTLVLEAVTLSGDRLLDSARLTAQKNTFAFRAARPETPEFYRLRVGADILNLCIDSTESVTIHAQMSGLATDYTVEGSEKCEQLRLLSVEQQLFRSDINKILSADGMSPSQRREAVATRVETYKSALTERFIAPDPSSAVAYSALFQTFGGQMIFNPMSNRRDARWIAAVATAWDLLYPGAERTENLHNVALLGLANTNPPREIEITSDKIHETGILDISLNDVDGNERRLSDLQGKVVLLDFTIYGLPEAAQRQLMLRDLYSRYATQGLEIYQVSFDPDRHFWATRVEQLPWVCVRCDEGLNADLLRLYNVQALPSAFLIDRSNSLHARCEMVDDVEAEIKKLL